LTSLNERPTVEFRWFNGTLHAGRIKAYVQLCAHLAASALETKQVVWKSRTIAAPRYDMKAMATMLRAFAIDPKDEEYATAFDVLTRAFRTRVTARQEPEA
jgi:hypothetical protein